MWVFLLIPMAAVLGFLLGLKRGRIVASKEAFEAGKRAALAQRKRLIRMAFNLGLQKGISESRTTEDEHPEHI